MSDDLQRTDPFGTYENLPGSEPFTLLFDGATTFGEVDGAWRRAPKGDWWQSTMIRTAAVIRSRALRVEGADVVPTALHARNQFRFCQNDPELFELEALETEEAPVGGTWRRQIRDQMLARRVELRAAGIVA